MLIVLAAAFCGRCVQAAQDIWCDATFASRLAKTQYWVRPQTHSFAIDVVQKWQRTYPLMPLKMADRVDAWPTSFGNWDTPAFYALKDGVRVDSLAGWPVEGSKQRLAELLDRLQAR